MARKATKKTDVSLWEKAKWKGFVNVSLSQQERRTISDNLLGAEECFQFLMDVVEDGYKVSLSYSIPEDVHTVSLTGIYQGRPNAGLTMSMRHRDFDKALTAVKWCYDEAGKNGSWEERFALRVEDDW